jgi:Zn-finger nucleic acid-binding protein
MRTTSYEGVDIETCPHCFGVWLDHSKLSEIIAKRERTWSGNAVRKVMEITGTSGIPESERHRNLYCPNCISKLVPTNYQNNSGIIIDICTHGHGVWLDRGELSRVQIFMEEWERIRARDGQLYQDILGDKGKQNSLFSEMAGTRIAVACTIAALIIGLYSNDLGKISIVIGSCIPLSMLLFPWFFVWDVAGRKYGQPSPIHYVVVFGWCALVINFIRILYSSYTN